VTTELTERIATTPVAKVQRGGAEIIDSLAVEWRELCRELPDDQPFYHPEWASAYVRHQLRKKKITLITVRCGGRLRAVLPLVEEWRIFLKALPVRVLRGATEMHTWRWDLVRTPGPEQKAVVEAVWKSLRSIFHWDLIKLPDIPEGGAAEELLDLARRDGFIAESRDHMQTPIYRIASPGAPSSSDFMPRSRNLQHSLHRILRKVAASRNMTLERYEKVDDRLLTRFYDLERAGWKGEEGTAIASHASTRVLFDDLARAAADNGYLSMYFLKLDGRDAAAHFGLSFGGTYFMVKCAYDETFRSFSPGHLMVHEVLRDCAERGLSTFDFMAHGEEWKRKWSLQFRPHAHLYVFGRGMYGRFLSLAKVKIAPAIKRRLRSSPNGAARFAGIQGTQPNATVVEVA
jgi:CelD/BcsL family acetyltransferase involved in cellulose biosynthesis